MEFIRFYLGDLRTDLRKPHSRLDFINQILRRFLLIIVKCIDENDGRQWYSIRYWPKYYKETQSE